MIESRRGVRTVRRGWPAAVAILVVGVMLAACGGDGPANPAVGAVPDADYVLTANNGTDRALELFVNESKVADVAAKAAPSFKSQDLPPLPWNVELRLPTGRTLLTLAVASGSVIVLDHGSQSPGSRVDLSCGRIDLYVNYPLLGPAPLPGHPGDCGP